MRLYEAHVSKEKAEADQIQVEKRRQLQNACFKPELQKCIDWIQSEKADEFDALAKICENKKVFTCKNQVKPLKVREFDPKCELKESGFWCERGIKKEYVITVVTPKTTGKAR